jgi:hypothetical protein
MPQRVVVVVAEIEARCDVGGVHVDVGGEG